MRISTPIIGKQRRYGCHNENNGMLKDMTEECHSAVFLVLLSICPMNVEISKLDSQRDYGRVR